MEITKPTFVNAKRMEVSTIDYFLYDHDLKEKLLAVERFDFEVALLNLSSWCLVMVVFLAVPRSL